ncbi:MAG: aldo/keto reductase [Actinomycetaceae bacterium]|nr:aldo/keto reductase [Actinomycetaceae bacterium]
MRYIEFGQDQDKVSEIIIGLMRVADMTPKALEELVQTGLDEGINFLDTADCYANGRAEEVLGAALARKPGLRDEVFLQSKCGIRNDEDFTWFDFSKEHILEAVDGSLKRLQTDHLDNLLLHRPDALMEPEEIAEAFTILHESGKVRNFGVSNQNPIMMDLIRKYVSFPITANQVQLSAAFTPAFDAGFHVNMQTPTAIVRDGSLFEYCRLNDIVIQAWSVMQYGFFEGVFIGSEKYPELNAVLDRIAAEKGVSSTAIALAWVLRYPGRMQAVTGTTKPERIKLSAQATDVELTKKEWYEIYLSAGNDLP